MVQSFMTVGRENNAGGGGRGGAKVRGKGWTLMSSRRYSRLGFLTAGGAGPAVLWFGRRQVGVGRCRSTRWARGGHGLLTRLEQAPSSTRRVWGIATSTATIQGITIRGPHPPLSQTARCPTFLSRSLCSYYDAGKRLRSIKSSWKKQI